MRLRVEGGVAAGALAALLVVVALGAVVHRPLARVPENTLKFVVGVLLCAFGTFWAGEGMGYAWPGQDVAIPGLIAAYLVAAVLCVRGCRRAIRGHHDAFACRQTVGLHNVRWAELVERGGYVGFGGAGPGCRRRYAG